MISIDKIRENPDLIRKDLEKRGENKKVLWIERIAELDSEWRKLVQDANKLRKRKNEINKKIIEYKKAGKKCTAEIKDSKRIDLNIKEAEKNINKLKEKIDSYLWKLPNILHESVPVGADDSENVPIKYCL